MKGLIEIAGRLSIFDLKLRWLFKERKFVDKIGNFREWKSF
jgi:hypothetical protein